MSLERFIMNRLKKIFIENEFVFPFESLSNPPSGKLKVVNIYVDPITEKFIVKYDSEPAP